MRTVRWSPTIRRLVLAVALAPAVFVAGALSACTPTPGGTASVTRSDFTYTLTFNAVTGRGNNITVSLDTSLGDHPKSVLLTDSRHPVTPGSGCARVNDNTVRCEADLVFSLLDIQLGDGNDTFASSAAMPGQSTVDAGPGNDTVNVGPAAPHDDDGTRVLAGAGDDTINGGTGNDGLSGGTGNDTLRGRAGFDRLDGGTETDDCDVGPDGGTTVNCETGP